jgi:hypothetical protein
VSEAEDPDQHISKKKKGGRPKQLGAPPVSKPSKGSKKRGKDSKKGEAEDDQKVTTILPRPVLSAITVSLLMSDRRSRIVKNLPLSRRMWMKLRLT